MFINNGNLRAAGWQQVNANFFYKDGLSLWYFGRWTLEITPKSDKEKAHVIKEGIRTMEDLEKELKAL